MLTRIFFILGDINIDISPQTISCMNNNYLNMLAEHDVVTLTNYPTRIASTSATTIDRILTNVLQYQLFPGIINNDLTDHLPVFVKASCCIKKSYKYDKPVRSLVNFYPEQFREDLLERMSSFYGNFQNIPKNNIEYFFSEFHSFITSTIDFLVDWKLLYGSLSAQILNSYYSIITKNYRLIFYMSKDGSFIIFLQFFV